MPVVRQGSPLTIELLDKNRHDRTGFDCGVLALNTYLQRQAALVESTFYGYTTYFSPGGENDFGLQAATFVLLGQ